MPSVDVYNLEKTAVGKVDLDAAVFDVEVREHLFHEVVRAQLAARRSGTASTKSRGMIRGSQAKLYRQKGTGRARAGSAKSPTRRSGGTAFGPQPRSHAKKVNKKTRAEALRCALSRRQQEGRLFVLENFEMEAIKTRAVADVLARFETPGALIIDDGNDTLRLSTRNLVGAAYLAVEGLNVYDVLLHDSLLVTRGAVEAIEGRLAK